MKYIIKRTKLTHSDVYGEDNHHIGTIDFQLLDWEMTKLHTESGHDYKILADSAFGFDMKLKEGSIVLDKIKIKLKWFSLYGIVVITTGANTEYTLSWSGFKHGKLIVSNQANEKVANLSWNFLDMRVVNEWTLETVDNDPEINSEDMIMLLCFCFVRNVGF